MDGHGRTIAIHPSVSLAPAATLQTHASKRPDACRATADQKIWRWPTYIFCTTTESPLWAGRTQLFAGMAGVPRPENLSPLFGLINIRRRSGWRFREWSGIGRLSRQCDDVLTVWTAVSESCWAICSVYPIPNPEVLTENEHLWPAPATTSWVKKYDGQQAAVFQLKVTNFPTKKIVGSHNYYLSRKFAHLWNLSANFGIYEREWQ